MKPGPPPIPFPLKRLRGNRGHQRLHAEPEPRRETQCPDPPPFLAPSAREEWSRVAPELHRLGLLTVIDAASLGTYCQCYARWRESEEALAKIAAGDPVTHGLVFKTAEGNLRRNPLVQIAADAAAAMVKYAAEFGLTPAARSRVSAAKGGAPESKFGPLLVG